MLAVEGTGPLKDSSQMVLTAEFYTSELQDEITVKLLEGDASRTVRRFLFGFGLFERTEILLPGQVGRVGR